jgi:hypothetical protein
MGKKDKLIKDLDYLQSNHLGVWLKTRQEVQNEISDRQSMACVCGHLATGLHEMNCRKFKDKVLTETIKKLKHLLPKET